MNSESISGSLQENLLTLLCFDIEAIPLILNSVELGLFENKFYRTIAEKAKNFYTSFKRPIGEHLPDTLEKELDNNDEDAEIYEEIIFKLHDFKDSVNKDYVIGQLTTFIREQNLKSALTESVKQVQAGNIEKAEQLINEYGKKSVETFDSGLFLSHKNFEQIFREDATEVFRTDIKVLDDLHIGLARGELLVVLAPANSGKTNFLIHLGKAALKQRLKVLHVTLEMSEEKIVKRYLQSFYSMTKRPQRTTARYLETNELGKFSGIRSKVLQRPALSDKTDLENLKKKVEKYGARTRVLVKQFPTSALTIPALELYLDSLETFENFIPDVLLLDYPDLMKLDSNNLRESTGKIYKELRGIAVKRNIAVGAPSQSNRSGEDAKIVTLKHLAEDYSKAAIADNVISYSQTEDENNLGLARLFIAKARDEQKFIQILITQAYEMGQFCLSSVKMEPNYWREVESLSGGTTPEPSDEPRTQQRRPALQRPKPRISV